MNIGIIGTGWIARKMVQTLASCPRGCRVYAVASRSTERASAFAAEFSIPLAYASYEEMLSDPKVDLVYIASPHSHHFEHAMLALRHSKACLVEKAFTANARQATELLQFAKEQNTFITEAIWTRYMPLSMKVTEILESGVIGEPRVLTATLCYMMEDKERIVKAELCGGALLDLGVYVLNFARMYFGTDYEKVVSNCILGPGGMDMHECISLTYPGAKMANLQAGALCLNDRQGIISGTNGYLRVDNVNCPERIEVWREYELVDVVEKPLDMITGYEYQVFECQRCMSLGLLESPLMPHSETLAIMQQMDSLRAQWGVRYPWD